jgi:hypothetical protein
MVTLNRQSVELPASSVAVQVTKVSPRGKAEPEAGLQLTAGLSVWLSVAVA